MHNFNELASVFDFNMLMKDKRMQARLLFDYFADQVDNELQNSVFSELLVRYADVSKQLEEYSERLEELVQDKVKEISASQIATIRALVKAAEARDDDTGAHIERTSKYCELIAEKLQKSGEYKNIIDKDYIDNISKASPLHDIGKVGIPDVILLKPGRLTEDEFDIMKTHVKIGYETLASVEKTYKMNTFIKTGMEIARYHHEKWDGSGYMLGLARESIPLSARIMALSDVYDALRSKRAYKEAYSHERTADIIAQGRGLHFDPVITDIFMENNRLFSDIYNRMSDE